MLFENTCSDVLLNTLRKIQSNTLFKDYLLVGGTSLSLQLGHRKSIDIDLFTDKEQDNKKILDYLENNFSSLRELNNNENILQVEANGIKIDFVKASGKLYKEPIAENGILLCSIEDIAGMKLGIVSDGRRCVPKDYIDIAYLIEKLSLEKMFEIYKYKNNGKDIHNVKTGLANVIKVNPFEWSKVEMVSKSILISEVPRIIREALTQYNKKEVIQKKSWFGFRKG